MLFWYGHITVREVDGYQAIEQPKKVLMNCVKNDMNEDNPDTTDRRMELTYLHTRVGTGLP